jgi:hypothetical protein
MEDGAPSWYSVVNGAELHQGDILQGFPVSVVQAVRSADENPNVFIEPRDVIVLTQSCDLPKQAQTSVLLAQVVSYDQFCSDNGSEVQSEKYRKKLVENIVQPFFLLRPAVHDASFPWSLVSFRDLHVAPKDEVQLFAATLGDGRLRLESPYREHLSQSYARFMMRVGLPSTTHDFVNVAPVR